MSVVTGPDNQKLSEWIEQYERELLHLCCVNLRDIHMAEDAVQETFLRAYRHMDAFRGECSVKTWLYSIAMRVCHDMRRSAWYRFIDRRVDMEKLAIPADGMSDVGFALMEEILRLPKKQREAVYLYYYENMKLTEIAQLLDISVSTVSDRLRKARVLLRKALKGGKNEWNMTS